MHYVRWQRHGDPLVTERILGDHEARFLSKVAHVTRPVAPLFEGTGPCWDWQGSLNRGGYGQFNAGDGKVMLAHRWAYEHWIGPIPEGLQLDHMACDTPRCVNPMHVRPSTARANGLRSRNFAGMNSRKTHCPAGHPYEGANLYVYQSGGRMCRKCHNIREKARQKWLRQRNR